MEKFTNFGVTSLAGNITSSATTITLASVAAIPATGTVSLVIGQEVMKATGPASGNNVSVTRGEDGSTAVSHTDLSPVLIAVTPRSLNQFRLDVIGSGAWSSGLTISEGGGRLFFPTNADVIQYDDGGSVKGFHGLRKLVPPDVSAYSWVNQGGATESTLGGMVTLKAPAASGNNVRARVRTYSSPYSLVALLTNDYREDNVPNGGLTFYDGTKFSAISLTRFSGRNHIFTYKYDNVTTFNAVYDDLIYDHGPTYPQWLKVRDDGTNLIFSYGIDGKNFTAIRTVSRTDFFPSGPTHIGYYLNANNGSNPAHLNLMSLEPGT